MPGRKTAYYHDNTPSLDGQLVQYTHKPVQIHQDCAIPLTQCRVEENDLLHGITIIGHADTIGTLVAAHGSVATP
ncbi:MAG: hypothetical protein P8179_10530 [Candidatus Thiodiazotropha sp.]|jgi:hypothetical protein